MVVEIARSPYRENISLSGVWSVEYELWRLYRRLNEQDNVSRDEWLYSQEVLEVVYIAKQGNRDAFESILLACRLMILSETKKLFLPRMEKDKSDLLLAGAFGVFRAIRDFKSERAPGGFRPFARLCIAGSIKDTVSAARRQWHIHLNEAFSLEALQEDDGEIFAHEVDEEADVDFGLKQTVAEVFAAMRLLTTPIEYHSLLLYCEGYSYKEIAEILECKAKSVDNAFMRCKRKIKELLQDIDDPEQVSEFILSNQAT
ncbi:MAG: sigma-70 family RNA polymerase sigma factor [bacterium]|nr:sigma-70 family RNA polymerase sigma factor [bacterium]